MRTFLFALSTVSVLAWLPILLRFFWGWRERRNPLSLAICGLIAFAMYASPSVCWPLLGTDARWVAGVMVAVNLAVCGNFYLGYRWARKKFPDARSRPPGTRPVNRFGSQPGVPRRQS